MTDKQTLRTKLAKHFDGKTDVTAAQFLETINELYEEREYWAAVRDCEINSESSEQCKEDYNEQYKEAYQEAYKEATESGQPEPEADEAAKEAATEAADEWAKENSEAATVYDVVDLYECWLAAHEL